MTEKMKQVELYMTIDHSKTKGLYAVMLTGIKRPITVEGKDKMKCVDKCLSRIIHPELFDIIIKDETNLPN